MPNYTTFIPGLELAELFYAECVQPIVTRHFPDLQYSAALIGSGSEVLGFDTEMSSDHHWGPRVMIFLQPHELWRADEVSIVLSEELPYTFKGYPTSFTPPNPDDHGVQSLEHQTQGPVNHRVEFTTIERFLKNYLAFDPAHEPAPADWLSFPQQKLRSIVSGKVFHDQVGLEDMRKKFAFYPHDVWLYLLASAWARIEQSEHLMGRAGYVGDELGSALIAARLVQDVMRLGFLMEKQYAPYSKWFGTAFRRLECAAVLEPHLTASLAAKDWSEREQHLTQAYQHLAKLQNALAITGSLPESVQLFHGRPFQVISMGAFSDAILFGIMDPAVRLIAIQRPIGNIDLLSDNTDLLEDTSRREAIRALFAGPARPASSDAGSNLSNQ